MPPKKAPPPSGEATGRPAMIPAMWVPWPYGSAVIGFPERLEFTKSTVATIPSGPRSSCG